MPRVEGRAVVEVVQQSCEGRAVRVDLVTMTSPAAHSVVSSYWSMRAAYLVLLEDYQIQQVRKDAQQEEQGLLCGLLQTCITKLQALVKPFADPIFELFLRVLNSKSVTVHEETLMAIGALANGKSN